MEQAYTDFTADQKLNVRAGRFLTPAGIWLIHHYPPFVPTQARPQHIRKIFPQYTDGVSVFGDFNMDTNLLYYNLYYGNGEGNQGHGDGNQDKAVGGRLQFIANGPFELKAGASGYTDTLNNGTGKTSIGADLAFRYAGMKFQSEYAIGDYDPAEGNTYRSIGYYAQVQYSIGRHTIFYRYDFYEPSDQADLDQVTVNTGGMNYHWTPTVVSKIEINSYAHESGSSAEDYVEWILSSAIFF